MAETSKKKNPEPRPAKTAAPDASAKAAKPRAAKTAGAAATGDAAAPAPGAADAAEATKFAVFVQSKKLNPHRILVASRLLEKLRPEDRENKLRKRRARASEAGDAAAKETRKPRSGRPVTHRALQAAMKGGQLSGPTKTRILRAINHLLNQKNQPPIDLRALF